MRVLVGPPLKRPPYHQIVADSLLPAFSTINKEPTKVSSMPNSNSSNEGNFRHPDDPVDLYIFCTSDFTTVSREVHLRTRRVRLLGLEVLLILFVFRRLNIPPFSSYFVM